ncbi:hypothetical protein [Pseudomonas sp. NPDC089569]|uniref:hypothetical protein n=1 Tax=Pseudomonas sp. NPDC089569 TaxID=3390722 RepID=UPI003D0828AD
MSDEINQVMNMESLRRRSFYVGWRVVKDAVLSIFKSDVVGQDTDKNMAENSGSNIQQQTASLEFNCKSKKWRAVRSSQFLSYRAQLNAYNEALTREARNMPRFTGEDSKGNLVVRMEIENVGRGYEPNLLDPANPRYIPKMNAFEMKFDFETLQPIALYPIEKI